jgi:hypothetical protein
MLLMSGYAIRCCQYAEGTASINYDIYKVAERSAVDRVRPFLALYEEDFGKHPEAAISLLVGDGDINLLGAIVIESIALNLAAWDRLK